MASSHVDSPCAAAQHLALAYLHHILTLMRSILLVGSREGCHQGGGTSRGQDLAEYGRGSSAEHQLVSVRLRLVAVAVSVAVVVEGMCDESVITCAEAATSSRSSSIGLRENTALHHFVIALAVAMR